LRLEGNGPIVSTKGNFSGSPWTKLASDTLNLDAFPKQRAQKQSPKTENNLVSLFPVRWTLILLLGALVVGSPNRSLGASEDPRDVPAFRPDDPLNAPAFEHFYNLEYDQAVQGFEQVLRRHPDDPFAINHLISGLLIRELYRMGAMNTGEYANDSFIGQAHRPADPKVKAEIQQLVQRAEGLEEQELKANSNNVDALYARGATRAAFALYTALIERAWFSALRNAVGARHDHERVLELDPKYVDAKLVVGTHNYVMGSLPWAVKAAVSMVGLSGSKEKGLQYLSEVAKSKGENSVDAQVILCLFLRREHRYDEALVNMRSLIPRYPHNMLFAIEEGNLLRTAGRPAEAAAVYRKVWQAGREGHYSGLHYELATLALGDVLRSQKDYSAAASAYEQVYQVTQGDPEILQKADLGTGEMYDLLEKRDLALKKYEAVVAVNSSTVWAATARQHIQQPYHDAS
jgi:tetratricopeptide (TPR) repeat protein